MLTNVGPNVGKNPEKKRKYNVKAQLEPKAVTR